MWGRVREGVGGGGGERERETYCYLERHALYTEGCLFLTQLSQGNLVTRNRVKLNSSYPLCHPDALSSLSYSPISFCPFSQFHLMCSALTGPEIPMLCLWKVFNWKELPLQRQQKIHLQKCLGYHFMICHLSYDGQWLLFVKFHTIRILFGKT